MFACSITLSILKSEFSFSTDCLQSVPISLTESAFSSLERLTLLFLSCASRYVYSFTLSCFSFLKKYTLNFPIIMFPLFQTEFLSSNFYQRLLVNLSAFLNSSAIICYRQHWFIRLPYFPLQSCCCLFLVFSNHQNMTLTFTDFCANSCVSVLLMNTFIYLSVQQTLFIYPVPILSIHWVYGHNWYSLHSWSLYSNWKAKIVAFI